MGKEFIEESSQWDGSNSSKIQLLIPLLLNLCRKSPVIGILVDIRLNIMNTKINEITDNQFIALLLKMLKFGKIKPEINYTGEVYVYLFLPRC